MPTLDEVFARYESGGVNYASELEEERRKRAMQQALEGRMQQNGGRKGGNLLTQLIPFGEVIRKLKSGEKVTGGEVALETGLSLIPLGLGKLAKAGKLGLTASKMAKAKPYSGAVRKTGESMAVRSIGASPSQLTKFAAQRGEDVTKTLSRHGLEGADADTIFTKAIQPLQNSFDKVVGRGDIAIAPKTVRERFQSKVRELKGSGPTANKALAQRVSQELDSISKGMGREGLSLSEATRLRRTYDGVVKNFAADEVQAGPNRVVRNVLNDVIQDTADKAGLKVGERTVKEAGRELSRLYDLHDIAVKQANKGRGSLPLGLTTLLGGIGGGIGGVAGGVPGGIGGIAAGAAVTKALNSPRVIGAASRRLTKTASGMQKLGESPVGSVLRAGRSQAAVRLPFVGTSTPTDPLLAEAGLDFAGGSGSLPSDVSQTSLGGEEDLDTLSGGITRDQILRAMQEDLERTGGKNIPELNTIYQVAQEGVAKGGAGKPMGAEAQKRTASAQAGLRALSRVQTILSQDPSKVIKGAIPGGIGARDYQAVSREVMDAISRLRTGAALTTSEMSFYQKFLPQPLDDEATKRLKLRQLQEFFAESVAGARQIQEPAYGLPSSPQDISFGGY